MDFVCTLVTPFQKQKGGQEVGDLLKMTSRCSSSSMSEVYTVVYSVDGYKIICFTLINGDITDHS